MEELATYSVDMLYILTGFFLARICYKKKT